ncbi:latrophilin Cirl-like [Ptychodera flava]|uniref:latrophilin Cirl-like n=1 Tax=Ptychodera flava TaxID=63121 RepID=UPI00396A7B6F
MGAENDDVCNNNDHPVNAGSRHMCLDEDRGNCNPGELLATGLDEVLPEGGNSRSHVNLCETTDLSAKQTRQLDELVLEYDDVFAKNGNDLRNTNIVQHRIDTGTVYRFCRSDATWEVADYTRCVSPTLASLNTQTGNLDGSPSGYLHLAEDLQNASKPAKLVVSGDLLTAVTIMYALVEDSFLVTCNATSAVVMNFTEAVLISARQLLDNSYSSLWTETHQVSDVDAIFTFLEKLDSFYGDVLSCFSLVNITEYSLVTENLDVAIEVFQANTSEAFIFPSNSNSDANQATVPVAVFTEADTSGHTAACIVWYKSASSLLPSTDINARSAHQDGQINSDVVSVTLHPTQVQPFNEPITLRFSHHQAGNNPVCALLDVSLTSSSVWSDSECETVSTTSDVTTCNCHHATNFALLTTLNDDDTVLKVPLNAIMVTGVVISLLFWWQLLYFCYM